MRASYGGHERIVSYLLERGAGAAVVDNGGKTALDWAKVRVEG